MANSAHPSRLGTLKHWLDSNGVTTSAVTGPDQIDWLRVLPFLFMHVGCIAVIWVGVSATALAVAGTLYVVRMFAVTAFYHRYFSHRAFKTSRAFQFVFAVLGASCVQRGPIWWAAHHRHHHAYSDQPQDVHSPRQRGFWSSHMGWFLSRKHFAPDLTRVRDLLRYPELRMLDRFDILVPVALAAALFVAGYCLNRLQPQLDTSGGQLLVWGFFVSTVACYHATYTINSLCHRFGRRRYATSDDSRNNLWLALLTFGEGWHNNHHHYPASARQGFYWWEIDLTFYALKALQALGIVWDLKPVPSQARDARREHPSHQASNHR
jgi:stearoyl-CoA desaturase (Delta-9 desaturase)